MRKENNTNIGFYKVNDSKILAYCGAKDNPIITVTLGKLDSETYLIDPPKIFKDFNNYNLLFTIINKILEFLSNNNIHNVITFFSDDSENSEILEKLYEELDFKITKKNCLFQKSLDTIDEKEAEEELKRLKYYSMASTGEAPFIALFPYVQTNSLDIDAHIALKDPVKAYSIIKGNSLNEDTSFLGLKDETPIGFVLTSIESDEYETIAVIEFVGVHYKHRGNRYGKLLHLKALLELKRKGIKNCIGSTLESNWPMVNIYNLNKCTLVMTDIIYTKRL